MPCSPRLPPASGAKYVASAASSLRSDGQVFLDLLDRRGLVHAPTLRKEMAAEVAYFKPLAGGDLGEYGIQLDQDVKR